VALDDEVSPEGMLAGIGRRSWRLEKCLCPGGQYHCDGEEYKGVHYTPDKSRAAYALIHLTSTIFYPDWYAKSYRAFQQVSE
jgi:hypothetical protein